jgi:hypothetical protein
MADETTMRWWLGSAAVTLGLILIIFNIVGLFIPIAVHKSNLVRRSYQESLEALNRLDNSLAPEQLAAEANLIIAARIVHYWPAPGKSDHHVMRSFLENWFLAGMQRGEAWLANKGLTEIDIARVGRRDYRPILAKGVGLCGMAAIALIDYLDSKGIQAKLLGLENHVVVYVSVHGRNYILDPDNGVMIADVPTPPGRSIAKIVAAYRDAGYSSAKVQKLERTYAAPRMRLYELAGFQGGNRRLLITAEITKWIVPLALIALGGLLLRTSKTHPRRSERPAFSGRIVN